MKKNKTNRPEKKTHIAIAAPAADNKYAKYGIISLFLILVFLLSSYKIYYEDDFFWHLASGRYIVENKTVPDKDVFGFVTQGSEWIPFEWGWDVFSYSLHSIGGINLVLVVRSLIFCLIFFLYFRLLLKFRVNFFISLVLLLVLLFAILDRLSARPHIITYLFFMVLIYILFSYKYIEREKYSKRLYVIPVIFLIWANFHMGVLAGGLVLFIFTAAETIIYYKPKKFGAKEIAPLTKNELKKIWVISVLSALALLINPNGINTYIYVYDHTSMKLIDYVAEWTGPFSGKADPGITLTFYKLFLFSALITLIYATVKKDLLAALMTIVFVIYSVRALRFTVDYEIIILFYIALSLNYFISNLVKNKPQLANILNGNILKALTGGFIIYLIVLVYTNSIYSKINYYRVYGLGIDEAYVPVELIEFQKANNISGLPFNSYPAGGYLIWNIPAEKNYIDSRALSDEIFFEYMQINNMKQGFDKKLEQRGIDYVIYFNPEMTRTPNNIKKEIAAYLSTNPNWKLVFWDDKSMLFVKDIPKFKDVIDKYEFKYITPYNLLFSMSELESNVSQNIERVSLELKRKEDTEPKGEFYNQLKNLTAKHMQGR